MNTYFTWFNKFEINDLGYIPILTKKHFSRATVRSASPRVTSSCCSLVQPSHSKHFNLYEKIQEVSSVLLRANLWWAMTVWQPSRQEGISHRVLYNSCLLISSIPPLPLRFLSMLKFTFTMGLLNKISYSKHCLISHLSLSEDHTLQLFEKKNVGKRFGNMDYPQPVKIEMQVWVGAVKEIHILI